MKSFLYAILLFSAIIVIYGFSATASDALTTPTSGEGDLNAVIHTALLKDPRAQTLTPQEINAMAVALTAQAQAQGVTAQQIAYRPGGSGYYLGPLGQNVPSALNDSSLWFIAAALWLLSGILIGIIVLMKKNPHIRASHGMDVPPAI